MSETSGEMSVIHGSKEKESPSLQVVRYSWKDEMEDDESYDPYYSSAQQGFDAFSAFIAGLKAKYPDRYFPRQQVLDAVNPTHPSSQTSDTNLVTYLAYKGDSQVVGGIVGKDEIGRMKGYWLAVDPDYQNGETIKKLLERVQEDFDEVSLQASTFGYDNNLSEKRQVHRQNALVKYYERLGFRVDETNETYQQYRHVPGVQVPMIWKKDKAA